MVDGLSSQTVSGEVAEIMKAKMRNGDKVVDVNFIFANTDDKTDEALDTFWEFQREPETSECRFAIHFIDYYQLWEWNLAQAVIKNIDIGFIKYGLGRLAPEHRDFIIAAARLLCEAGGLEVRE